MASGLVFKYPLDYTGTASNNRVVGEIHDLSTNPNRAFVPDYGPFYTKGMVVVDALTGRVLERDTHYICLQTYADATEASGLEVCGVVLIIDPTVSNGVSFTGQMVGGQYSDYAYGLQQMINDLNIDNRVVVWGQIIGTPSAYPPAPHFHSISDTYGWEYLAAAIETLRQAILTGDQGSMDALRESLFSKLTLYQPAIGYTPVEQGVTLGNDPGKIKLSSDGHGNIIGSLNGFVLGQVLFSSSQINDVITQLTQRVTDLESGQTKQDDRLAGLENEVNIQLPNQLAGLSDTVLTNYNAIVNLTARVAALENSVTFGSVNEAPADGTTGASTTPTLVGDSYFPMYGVPQKYRHFELVDATGTFDAPLVTTQVAPSGSTPTLQVPISVALAANASYTWRYRDETVKNQFSVWSHPTYFSTSADYVAQPTVTSPANNANNVTAEPVIMLSAFATVGATADTLKSTSIRVKDTTGAVIWLQSQSTTQLNNVKIPAGVLKPNTNYTVEGRYFGNILGASQWSVPVVFTTVATFINTPSITAPANNAVLNTNQPTVSISPFAVTSGSDTLLSTSVRVKNASGTVVWSQDQSTSQLNNIRIPSGVMSGGNNYTIEAQYYGAKYGPSNWSPVVAVSVAVSTNTTVVTSRATATSVSTSGSTTTSFATSRMTAVGVTTSVQTAVSQSTSVSTTTSFATSLAFNTNVAMSRSTSTSFTTSRSTTTTYSSTNLNAVRATSNATSYSQNTAVAKQTGVVKSRTTTTYFSTGVTVCVAEGTPITMPDGSTIPVEALQDGTQLMSVMLPGLQPETIEEYADYHAASLEGAMLSTTHVQTTMRATVPKLYKIWAKDRDHPLRVTPEHPFLIQDVDGSFCFCTAEMLTLDDRLVDGQLRLLDLVKIETENGAFTIFKVDCVPLDLFIHDNIVGHNMKFVPSPTGSGPGSSVPPHTSYVQTSASTTTTWTSYFNTTSYVATTVSYTTSYNTTYSSTNANVTRSTSTAFATTNATLTSYTSARSTLTTWNTSRATVSSYVTSYTVATAVGSTTQASTSFTTSAATVTTWNSGYTVNTSFNTTRTTTL